MDTAKTTRQAQYAAKTGALVLGVIFFAEYGVMWLLPKLLGASPPLMVEAFVDSILLTTLVSPVLWWALVRPLRKLLDNRSQLLLELFALLEAERRRVAHDLHDGVGQSMTLLVSGLRTVANGIDEQERTDRIHHLRELAQRTLKEIKQLALTLRPSILDDLGLLPAMEQVAQDTREHFGLNVSITAASLQGVRLDHAVESALFRIFQEALNNVVRHANANTVQVEVNRSSQLVILQVSDDGVGISAKVLQHDHDVHACLGLVGMRERAVLLGGSFRVETLGGKGTRIVAELPVCGAIA